MDGATGDERLRELYANVFQIGFNGAEFMLDFGREFEGTPRIFYWRVITGPLFARSLLLLLDDAVRGYEERFGPIRGDLNP